MNPTLKLLFIANSLTVFATTLTGPLYALFIQKQFATKDVIYIVSTATFCTLLASLLGSAILSKFGDKLNHKSLLQFGFLGRGIIWALYPFVPNIIFVFFIQFIFGFFDTFGNTGYDSIFAENLDQKRHIRNYSSNRVIAYFSMLFAITIGAYVAYNYGFQPLFIFMSLLSFVSYLVVSRIK